jgi:RND superfamily putative drug exporter
MAFGLHRATPAIIASGMTVVLGMLCLLVAEMSSTRGMGPVAAVGILVALAVMVTLLPALLVITGRWIFWPARPRFGSHEPVTTGIWSRVGRLIAPRPRKVWAITSGLLAIACLGLLTLDAHGLPLEHSYTKDYDSVVGQRVLVAHGLADPSTPVQVVTDPAHAGSVRSAMTGIEGLGKPGAPMVKGDVALVSAPVKGDPASQAAFDTVDRVRTAVHRVPGADALVAGATAINRDIQSAATRDDKVVIPLVLVVVLLVLMVLLRAVVSPLLLVATVVLSFGAALGLSSLLFRYVLGFAGADASFPLFVFVFLVALGIDYNIFLMTRVREETHTRGTREGSLVALAATGGVITSAGLVLAATFSVLSTLPLVAFVEVGIAVALGVMLDTMVVRSVLVTSINLDLGSRIWWPSRLDRTAD